jgi:chloramphenicol 3-O-phosphotransferase
MRSAIVHLIGPPASGKLTIARALVEQAGAAHRKVVVLDNHHTNNVIFSVMDVDGVRSLPHAVWGHIMQVRATLLAAIEELSPPDWSFVFTNVLAEHDPLDHQMVADLSNLAAATDRRFVPVHLRCDPAELARRAANPDRRERMKWVDAEAIATFATDVTMLRVDSDDALDLDTTSRPPTESAALLLDHLLG